MSTKLLGVIEPKRAERFLLKLANSEPINVGMLADKSHPGMELAEKLRHLFPEMAEPLAISPSLWPETLTWVQLNLQLAWGEPDDRVREWRLYEIRRYYRDALAVAAFAARKENPPGGMFSAVPQLGISRDYVDRQLIDPPPVTPFEAATFYFQSRIGNLAKRCAHVDCPARYFIAPKPWNKFCSPECAGPGTRESKRKSWHKNKAKYRDARRGESQ